MDTATFMADAFTMARVPPDGDCWIAATLTSMGVAVDKASIALCRTRVKQFAQDNKVDLMKNMDVKNIAKVTKQASYAGNGRLISYGNWGEDWHLACLAIVLGVDIVGFVQDKDTYSVYHSSGAQIYYAEIVPIEYLVTRRDYAAILYNGVDHFEALVPHVTTITKPPWLVAICDVCGNEKPGFCVCRKRQSDASSQASTSTAVQSSKKKQKICLCDMCDKAMLGEELAMCLCCNKIFHKACLERLSCDAVCPECDE